MKVFLPYVQRLESLLRRSGSLANDDWETQTIPCLNGEPGHELRRSAALADLRRIGAFFTGHQLAQDLVNRLGPDPGIEDGVYLDPTCGAGDLLLAAAQHLPLGDTIAHTLNLWGKRLAGYDISEAFVRATRARLALLAMTRHKCRCLEPDTQLIEAFPMIKTGDALAEQELYQRADSVLMNPPFPKVDAPKGCRWGAGKVNAAAIFTEAALRSASRGTRVISILPDVLRSGDRYQLWRETVHDLARLEEVSRYGLFDQHADVDVFIASMIIGRSRRPGRRKAWVPSAARQRETVGTHFEVHVGAVVPHRHEERGARRRYIHARSLPAWETLTVIRERRRFMGTVFRPPFVAVRRTSRPDDRKRAIPTIILGKGAVAVENHLIVLLPRDGTLWTCQQLVRRLCLKNTDQWLNRRIRCRHLTVSALSGMPWWEES